MNRPTQTKTLTYDNATSINLTFLQFNKYAKTVSLAEKNQIHATHLDLCRKRLLGIFVQ